MFSSVFCACLVFFGLFSHARAVNLATNTSSVPDFTLPPLLLTSTVKKPVCATTIIPPQFTITDAMVTVFPKELTDFWATTTFELPIAPGVITGTTTVTSVVYEPKPAYELYDYETKEIVTTATLTQTNPFFPDTPIISTTTFVVSTTAASNTTNGQTIDPKPQPEYGLYTDPPFTNSISLTTTTLISTSQTSTKPAYSLSTASAFGLYGDFVAWDTSSIPSYTLPTNDPIKTTTITSLSTLTTVVTTTLPVASTDTYVITTTTLPDGTPQVQTLTTTHYNTITKTLTSTFISTAFTTITTNTPSSTLLVREPEWALYVGPSSPAEAIDREERAKNRISKEWRQKTEDQVRLLRIIRQVSREVRQSQQESRERNRAALNELHRQQQTILAEELLAAEKRKKRKQSLHPTIKEYHVQLEQLETQIKRQRQLNKLHVILSGQGGGTMTQEQLVVVFQLGLEVHGPQVFLQAFWSQIEERVERRERAEIQVLAYLQQQQRKNPCQPELPPVIPPPASTTTATADTTVTNALTTTVEITTTSAIVEQETIVIRLNMHIKFLMEQRRIQYRKKLEQIRVFLDELRKTAVFAEPCDYKIVARDLVRIHVKVIRWELEEHTWAISTYRWYLKEVKKSQQWQDAQSGTVRPQANPITGQVQCPTAAEFERLRAVLTFRTQHLQAEARRPLIGSMPIPALLSTFCADGTNKSIMTLQDLALVYPSPSLDILILHWGPGMSLHELTRYTDGQRVRSLDDIALMVQGVRSQTRLLLIEGWGRIRVVQVPGLLQNPIISGIPGVSSMTIADLLSYNPPSNYNPNHKGGYNPNYPSPNPNYPTGGYNPTNSPSNNGNNPPYNTLIPQPYNPNYSPNAQPSPFNSGVDPREAILNAVKQGLARDLGMYVQNYGIAGQSLGPAAPPPQIRSLALQLTMQQLAGERCAQAIASGGPYQQFCQGAPVSPFPPVNDAVLGGVSPAAQAAFSQAPAIPPCDEPM